jgi:hypothetical protein
MNFPTDLDSTRHNMEETLLRMSVVSEADLSTEETPPAILFSKIKETKVYPKEEGRLPWEYSPRLTSLVDLTRNNDLRPKGPQPAVVVGDPISDLSIIVFPLTVIT